MRNKPSILADLAIALGALGIIAFLSNKKPNTNERRTNEDGRHAKQQPQAGQRAFVADEPIEKCWHAEERDHRAEERKYWRATLVLTAGALIGAVASAYIGWRTLDAARTALILGHRAWLAPTKASIAWQREGRDLQTFKPEHPIHIDVGYRNVGKTPATAFVASFDIRSFEKPASGNWNDTFPPEITFCDGIAAKGDAVIYPSDQQDFLYEISSNRNNIVRQLTERIVEGYDVLYVVGCFAYKSLGKERKSQFCFMLNPVGEDPHEWQFRSCIRGNRTFGDN